MPILDSPAGTAAGGHDEAHAGTYLCKVQLPANADVIGVRCFARQSGNNPWYECIGGGNGHDCGGFAGSTNPLGYASFKGTYTVDAPGNAVIVSWVFSNWSEADRDGKIQVEYTLRG
jgi:hypothetical protein